MTNQNPTDSPIGPEDEQTLSQRIFSPSVARNKDVLREVFLEAMPSTGHILEIGSGSGEHAVHFAAQQPDLRWLPGDPRPECRQSIAAWTASCGLANVAAPHSIDVTVRDWQNSVHPRPVAGIVSINVIHIAPMAVAEGLFLGAGQLLQPDGRLFLYGPFRRQGRHTAASNIEFEKWLKDQDPRFGVRDLEVDLVPLAERASLRLADVIEMPANNFSVLFEPKT